MKELKSISVFVKVGENKINVVYDSGMIMVKDENDDLVDFRCEFENVEYCDSNSDSESDSSLSNFYCSDSDESDSEDETNEDVECLKAEIVHYSIKKYK